MDTFNGEIVRRIEEMPESDKLTVMNFLDLFISRYFNTKPHTYTREQNEVLSFLKILPFFETNKNGIEEDLQKLNLPLHIKVKNRPYRRGDKIISNSKIDDIIIIPNIKSNSLIMEMTKDNKIFKLLPNIPALILGEFELFHPSEKANYQVDIKVLRDLEAYHLPKDLFKELIRISSFSLWVLELLVRKLKLMNADLWKIKYLRYNLLNFMVEDLVKQLEDAPDLRKNRLSIHLSKKTIDSFEVIKGDASRCISDLKNRNNICIKGAGEVKTILISCNELMKTVKYTNLKEELQNKVCLKHKCNLAGSC